LRAFFEEATHALVELLVISSRLNYNVSSR